MNRQGAEPGAGTGNQAVVSPGLVRHAAVPEAAQPLRDGQLASTNARTKRPLEVSPWLYRRAVEVESVGQVVEQTGLVSRGPRGQLAGGTGLPRPVVRADQRARLMGAVVSVVAERGYAEATLREVLWRAGVSQKTMYANFAGARDALLTACDAALDWILEGVEEAAAAEARWSDGVREGLRCLLEWFAAEPEHAWCCCVELCALGSPGEECRLRALERLAAALSPAGIDPGPNGGLRVADELVAGGVWYAIEAAVLAGQQTNLISLLPELHRHLVLYERESDGRDQRKRWGDA